MTLLNQKTETITSYSQIKNRTTKNDSYIKDRNYNKVLSNQKIELQQMTLKSKDRNYNKLLSNQDRTTTNNLHKSKDLTTTTASITQQEGVQQMPT